MLPFAGTSASITCSPFMIFPSSSLRRTTLKAGLPLYVPVTTVEPAFITSSSLVPYLKSSESLPIPDCKSSTLSPVGPSMSSSESVTVFELNTILTYDAS